MDESTFDKLSRKLKADADAREISRLLSDKEPNLFRILKAADHEIRHSNFLAWLLNPAANHKLGDVVLKKFLKKVAPTAKITLGEVAVHRERSRIDLLIECETHVVCVENKWHSGEHSDQLSRYKKAVEANFPDLERIYVYLTLSGEDSSMPEVYRPISHQDIGDILEKLDYTGANKRTKRFIEQYLEILRGDAMMSDRDAGLTRKMRDLYKEHKELFDGVNHVIQTDKGAKKWQPIVREYQIERDYVLGEPDKKSSRYAKWYPKQLEQYNYINSEHKHWKTRETFLLDAELQGNEMWMYLIVTDAGDDYYDRKRLHQILCELEGKDKNWGNYTTYRRETYKFDLKQSDEGIRRQVEEIFADYQPNIDAILSHFEKHSAELLRMKRDAEAKRDSKR